MGDLHFHWLTADRWCDAEALFGKNGACGGCWCMYWLQTQKEYETGKGDANKGAFKQRVENGDCPGIIAYHEDRPVGWCALAPRQQYTRLARSRILKPLDGVPVWSIVCFFVVKTHRNQGVSLGLLQAAKAMVAERGGKTLEGYPLEPRKLMPPPFAYHGLASAFLKAGFYECARRSPTRPIMRFDLD